MRQKPPTDEEADQIEDEVGDSFKDDDGIEDFYGDDTFKNTKKGKKSRKNKEGGEGGAADGANDGDGGDGEDGEEDDDDDELDEMMDDDDLDLDYSQTQLDDFLKSQTSSSMMKGSNI